jgi:hypothetical protein
MGETVTGGSLCGDLRYAAPADPQDSGSPKVELCLIWSTKAHWSG